ncbi:hypothetical protein GCM10010983_23840 [Caulobacter rhizosphaerae]|nr:hypothetical protein GCM10010983_23840 [Caulobacter rhizosphaerae]
MAEAAIEWDDDQIDALFAYVRDAHSSHSPRSFGECQKKTEDLQLVSRELCSEPFTPISCVPGNGLHEVRNSGTVGL